MFFVSLFLFFAHFTKAQENKVDSVFNFIFLSFKWKQLNVVPQRNIPIIILVL